MFDICRSDTTGFWKKFTLAYLIKFFTYWYYKKVFVKKYPQYSGWKVEDMPQHAKIGQDKTFYKVINFESNFQQRLITDYGYSFRFTYKGGVDVELFWDTVDESIGQFYGVFQLYYFVKTWVWMTFFPFLVPLWSKLFHGNKDILWWGNPFVWFKICTETMVNLMQRYRNKYGVFNKSLSIGNTNNISPIIALDMLLTAEASGEVVKT